jgi:hypothetical protein
MKEKYPHFNPQEHDINVEELKTQIEKELEVEKC